MKYYVIYGGTWYLNTKDCRIFYYGGIGPGHGFGLGFRLTKQLKP
jgi:hypothetical protein